MVKYDFNLFEERFRRPVHPWSSRLRWQVTTQHQQHMLQIGASILWYVADDQLLGVIVEQVFENYGEIFGVGGKECRDVMSVAELIHLPLLELQTSIHGGLVITTEHCPLITIISTVIIVCMCD